MKLLNLLEKQYNLTAMAVSDRVKYDNKKENEFYAMCQFISIIENSYGCIKLLKKSLTTPTTIILRNIVELSIDLENIKNNNKYIDCLKFNDNKQRIKMYHNTLNSKNKGSENQYLMPILDNIGKDELEQRKKSLEKENIILKEKIKKEFDSDFEDTIQYKFKKVEHQDEYECVYALLCLDSHNNLSALEDRHISDNLEIICFKKNEEAEIRCIKTLSDILLNALIDIYEILNVENKLYLSEITNINKRINTIIRYKNINN